MEQFPDRLPLVIGVTGHRDLRESDHVKLPARIPQTLGALLSARAEGSSLLGRSCRSGLRIRLARGGRVGVFKFAFPLLFLLPQNGRGGKARTHGARSEIYQPVSLGYGETE